MNVEGILNLAADLSAGVQTFSEDDKVCNAREAEQTLREALKSANGGSTVFNYRTFRRNKTELFEIIEQLIDNILENKQLEDPFFAQRVEWVNLKKGDKNLFEVPEGEFVVYDIADGINTPRRQRLTGATFDVKTRIHTIRMYDEFSRFLAGRVDWAYLCNKVAEAFMKDIWADIYAELEGITATTYGMNETYVKTGTYADATLLDLCAHVEAATGVAPIIIGTAKALHPLNGSITALSDAAKDQMYNQGYCGKFYGYDVMKLRQIHKAGTDTFMMNDNILHVVAGDQKFIKFVEVGETYILEKDNTINADRTIEYLMEREYGVAIVLAGHAYGKYTYSTSET